MIHIITGGAGAGKSTFLMHYIQRHIREEDHILTLVPEQFSYEFDRKLYEFLGSQEFNQLETHSFKSLVRGIFQKFGCTPDGRTNADDLTKTALLYQAVLYTAQREKTLRILGKQCHQKSFLDELSMTFSVFRRSGITPDMLFHFCNDLSGRLLEKTMDLFQIYQRYDRLLAEHHLKDTETDFTEAAGIANGQDAFLDYILVIDEFESFTEDEYELLLVLFSSCREIYIALRTEDIEKQPFSLFESVNRTVYRIQQMGKKLHIPVEMHSCQTAYRFQAPELSWLSRHVFRNTKPFSGNASQIHILEATSPEEEAEYACTTIRRLLAENEHLRCKDIVLLSNRISDYQNILETVMERYELPYHLDEKRSVMYMPLMVYLSTLLELLCQKHYQTEALLRLGKTGLTVCTEIEIAELENYCYIWQIQDKTWQEPFSGGDWEQIEPIRQKLTAPLNLLRKSCQEPKTGAAYCQILYEYLVQQNIEEQLNTKLSQISDDLLRTQMTEDWAFVWNSFIDILDHLAQLFDEMEFEFSEFSTLLSAMLHSIQRAVPPQTLDAILISQGSTARLNEPKIVFLLGVCEGVFPAKASGNSIFSEKDCHTLEHYALPIVKSKTEQIADARLAAYKLLSAASQSLYLSYPTVDVSHQQCYPAAVLTQIQQMFPNTPQLKQTSTEQGSIFYASSLRAAYYRYIQDYTLCSSDTASIEQVLAENAFYRERLLALEKLTQQYTEEKDAPIFQIQNPQVMEQYLGDHICISASALETFYLCPFRYFCQYTLRLFSRKKLQVSGIHSGSLVHFCLEQIFRQYAKDAFLTLSPKQLTDIAENYANQYWENEMGGNFSKAQREIASFHKTVAQMHQLLLHLQEELKQTSFYPYAVEAKISPDSPDFPSIPLYTKSNHTIRLTGSVDRIDLCQDHEKLWLRVVDYKTGGKQFRLGNLLYGLDLQMLIYLFSVTAPGTILHKATPAGVLYLPAGGITSDADREKENSVLAKRNATYKMNGILLKDPHLVALMEQECNGIYIPAKVDAKQQIVTDNRRKDGVFLSEKQMHGLRNYVLQKLVDAAEQIYQGSVDAAPLNSAGYEKCSSCPYRNICGNADLHHVREVIEKSSQREMQVLQALEETTKEGEEA